MEAAKQSMQKTLASPDAAWTIGIPVLFVLLAIMYFTMSLWYKNQYGLYRSETNSINSLLAIRRQTLQSKIGPLTPNDKSVCAELLGKRGIYRQITEDKTAMVNWRPLTVRMAGYLGGDKTARDGVFDMSSGIQLALQCGARCFIFDIDYLEDKPCEPRLIHRDDQGIMRSLHTAPLKDGMDTLNKMAFNSNYDPVIIVIYFRRIPLGPKQKNIFMKAVASSLDPISTYHLGSTEQGNFHNCRSESQLFTSQITNFQKKFIVICNYNTNLLPSTSNPKDNLDFWTNARLYVDESGKSALLGAITASVPNGQIAYAKVGSTQQLLQIPADATGSPSTTNYNTGTSNTFTIALSSMDDVFTTTQLSTLLNTLGIQSVPIDVLRLASLEEHSKTLTNLRDPSSLADLVNATNPADPLSFWSHAGWSRKLIVEGFENMKPVPVAANIPGFIIPKAVVPKKPPPSTNSNGGLVNIA
jgi:hypothetical protein